MEVINVKVANLRKMGYTSLEQWLHNPDHVYIGRHVQYVSGATSSKWRNPFPVGESRGKYSLDESIVRYENHVLTTDLVNQLGELDGKILGCWCKPSKCHGDVLVKLLQKRRILM
jgi:hypothetical protein